jgi:uncharacterized protein (DUF488 family)
VVRSPVSAAAERDARQGPVLTIGHSTRTFERFVEILLANGVSHVVDVRRFPHSLRHPQFDQASLPEELRKRGGIGYSHLPGLGGRRRPRSDSPNAGWRNPYFRGYADHMATAEFGEDFERLLALCERERVCLMCSEAVWWRCHRRMIADALVVRGIALEHILGERQQKAHTLTPWAQVVGGAELVYPPEG